MSIDPRQELSNRANRALSIGLCSDDAVFWAQYGYGTEVNGHFHDPLSADGARFNSISSQIAAAEQAEQAQSEGADNAAS